MPTPTEIARIAAAANALRPDWPTVSVQTYLAQRHASRAYQDLAAAVAYLAADPATQTPKRLEQPGPWWHIGNNGAPRNDPAGLPFDANAYGRSVSQRASDEDRAEALAQARAAVRRARQEAQ